MVTIPLDLLNLLLAAALPILTALVTARFASAAWKTVVLAALTVIATSLQQVFDDNGDLHARSFLMTTSLQFLMSVGFHFGLLKPIAVTGDHGLVAQSVPAGIGAPKEAPVGPVED
jgi:hypothetical protein